MAKFVEIIAGTKVTIITDRNSAVAYFTYRGVYYQTKIKGQLITSDDRVDLIASAEKVIADLRTRDARINLERLSITEPQNVVY